MRTGIGAFIAAVAFAGCAQEVAIDQVAANQEGADFIITADFEVSDWISERGPLDGPVPPRCEPPASLINDCPADPALRTFETGFCADYPDVCSCARRDDTEYNCLGGLTTLGHFPVTVQGAVDRNASPPTLTVTTSLAASAMIDHAPIVDDGTRVGGEPVAISAATRAELAAIAGVPTEELDGCMASMRFAPHTDLDIGGLGWVDQPIRIRIDGCAGFGDERWFMVDAYPGGETLLEYHQGLRR